MLGVLELLTAVPASSVRRDDVVAVSDANLIEIGVDNERAPRPIVRNGVVIEVETNIGCFAYFDFESLLSREWIFG